MRTVIRELLKHIIIDGLRIGGTWIIDPFVYDDLAYDEDPTFVTYNRHKICLEPTQLVGY